ncbi:response regulator [bacterium]|nr:response regulator [bacterium]
MDTQIIRILIADDDSTHKELLDTLLRKRFQCEVLQAEDGMEALQIMLKDSSHLDLVIPDMNLPYPISNGLQVLSIMKSLLHFRELPVIACTAANIK